MTGPRILILVEGAQVCDELLKLTETLPWAKTKDLVFVTASGNVDQAITGDRERNHAGPLGYVAEDEPSALAALAAGADEAMVLPARDAQSLAAFIERVELRARVRAETQGLHVQFAHAEKLTALGTLIAGVSHEINNPLSALILCLDVVRRQLLPALDAASELASMVESGATASPELSRKVRESLSSEIGGYTSASIVEDMTEAATAIAKIVRDLRLFARTDDDETAELVNVCELIDNVLRLLGRDVFRHGLIERDYAPDLPLLVIPPNRVTQVLMNVLINAAHAIGEVARPVHRVRIGVRADEDFVAIAISDTGPGIPPEAVERIFDPFFTTKRRDLGTGLGLSISRSILRKLGGDMTVESVFGEGASFVSFLPVPTQESVRAAAFRRKATWLPVVASPAATVMVVDDDPRLLRSYARLLNAEHRVVIAHDGRDAIEILQAGTNPDLAVIELDLPGNDGVELMNWIAANRPALSRRTLLVASASTDPRHFEFLQSYKGPVLNKPLRSEVLLAGVARLLAGEGED
jgi:signal transduction histidine kinase/CheY-like chemotaxis protein